MPQILRPAFRAALPGWTADGDYSCTHLEQTSYRKVNTALAGGAYAACQGDWTDHRVGDDSEIECATDHDRARIIRCSPERRASLVPSTPVNVPSRQLGKAVELAAEAKRRIRVVIPQKLVGEIRAQPERPAEFKNLERSGRPAECRSAGNIEKQRRLTSERQKVGGPHIDLVDRVRNARRLQHS